MPDTIGIHQVQNRIIDVFGGAEYASDLAAIRAKYNLAPGQLQQPRTEERDIYRYDTMAPGAWPYMMVTWIRSEPKAYGRANTHVIDYYFKLAWGVRMGANELPALIRAAQAYIDAAWRTTMRAIRNGDTFDARPIEAAMGAGFTDSGTLIQYTSLDIVVSAYTTTETV